MHVAILRLLITVVCETLQNSLDGQHRRYDTSIDDRYDTLDYSCRGPPQSHLVHAQGARPLAMAWSHRS
jgi:hypothetical protein